MEDVKKVSGDKQSLKDKIERITDRDGCSYLEAISSYMMDNQLTPTKVAKSLCPYLMKKIEEEVKYSRLVKTEILAAFYSKVKSKVKKK